MESNKKECFDIFGLMKISILSEKVQNDRIKLLKILIKMIKVV